VVTLLALLTVCLPAFADPSVLLIVQGGIDQDPAPCELRLRSELAAEGLEVVTASSRTTQNLIDLEGLARRTGAVAGLSVFVDVQSIDGRLWVTDASSHVDLVRTLHVSRTEADPVSVFALRAVEALRGARLELEQQKRKLSGVTPGSTEPSPAVGGTTNAQATPATPSAADVASVPQKTKKAKPDDNKNSTESGDAESKSSPTVSKDALATQPRRWLVQAHGVLGWELNGIGSVLGGGVDLRRAVSTKFSVGLGFDGPLFSRLTSRVGSVVRIDQELLTAQIRWSAITVLGASLEVVGMTGASRFGVRGEAQAPTSGESSYGVSSHGFEWVGGVGIGIGIPLSSTIRFGFDVQWLRRLPAPVILDRQPPKIRRLTGDTDSLLLGKLGLGVSF
jgi:hypothetical protein